MKRIKEEYQEEDEKEENARPGPLSWKLEFYARKFDYDNLRKLIESVDEIPASFQELMSARRRWSASENSPEYFKLREFLFQFDKMRIIANGEERVMHPFLSEPFDLHRRRALEKPGCWMHGRNHVKDTSLAIFDLLETDISEFSTTAVDMDLAVLEGGRTGPVKIVSEGHSHVVVKQIDPGDALSDRKKHELQNEVFIYQNLATLQGECIPVLVDSTDTSLTTTYEGKSLYLLMQDGKHPGLVDDNFVLRCLSALRRIHKAGVLHKDIAIRNIVVRPSGIPIFIDFGFSVVRESTFSQEYEEIKLLRQLQPYYTETPFVTRGLGGLYCAHCHHPLGAGP